MIKDRFRQRSIKHKVIFLVMAQLLLTLLALILLFLFLVNKLTTEQAETLMAKNASTLSQKLEQRMLFLTENVQRLSSNRLVVNAVLEEHGRHTYLPLMVESFMQGKEVVSLSLIDNAGQAIYENHDQFSRFNDSVHLQMALALNKPVSYLDVQSKHFMVINPIKYLDKQIGMALIAFDLNSIVDRLIAKNSSGYIRLLKVKQAVFSDNYFSDQAYHSYSLIPQDDTPMLRQLGVVLEIGYPKDEYNAPIREALIALCILGLACLFVGILTSAWIAQLITQPIMTLYKRVRQAHNNEAKLCYPLGSGDELDDLAKAFDDRTLLLQHQAQHDTLTGLPNRSLFLDRLDQAINMAARNQEKLAVLFVDLDRFKEVNDSLGHNAGDELLIAVADKMQACIRSFDTVARFGGDEFCLLLNRVNTDEAVISVLQKIIQLFQQPLQLENQTLTITCSVGVAIYPDNSLDTGELLKQADAAMYRAKDEGRNTYEFFTHNLTEQAQERLLLENELRHAIAKNQLELFYQPQLCINSGRVLGLEALVRWNHPIKGKVAPDRFIPLAEETGLITSIDQWVLERSLQQMSQWLKQGTAPRSLSINMSMLTLHRSHFGDSISALLRHYNVPTARVMFEITETQAMKKPEQTISLLQQLKALGVRLAIDDFGTGFSSLSYLKRFPVDRIKIDKTFIRGLPKDQDDAGLTQAIISLSQSLNKEVIAEGVETLEQSDFLQSLGCCEAQGFLYYPPLSQQDVTALLLSATMPLEKALTSADKAATSN